MEPSKSGSGNEQAPAVSGTEKEVLESAADTSKNQPVPDPTADTAVSEPSEDNASPEELTPEQEAQRESEEHIRELLNAYQETLDEVEGLPAVVWVPWDRKRPGRYLKVPYLRWFLTYFVTYHINRSLDALNRRLHANAALSDESGLNSRSRETVKLYLQSLPRPPYRVLIFVAVICAVVIAVPLQSFGNVFYVLDLVGALLRFDVGYVGRALDDNQVGPTIQSVIVLLFGLTVVGAVLTSPFGLKRIVFNLHPWNDESFGSTAARDHGYRVEGLYILEERVFAEAGIRRPQEGRWDLMFQTFLLLLLLILGFCLTFMTLVILLNWDIHLKVNGGAPGGVKFRMPQVSWGYYALITALILTAFVSLLRRLVAAWKNRSRHAELDAVDRR